MLVVLKAITIPSLFINNLYILLSTILVLGLYALSAYLSIDSMLLIAYIIVPTIA